MEGKTSLLQYSVLTDKSSINIIQIIIFSWPLDDIRPIVPSPR